MDGCVARFQRLGYRRRAFVPNLIAAQATHHIVADALKKEKGVKGPFVRKSRWRQVGRAKCSIVQSNITSRENDPL